MQQCKEECMSMTGNTRVNISLTQQEKRILSEMYYKPSWLMKHIIHEVAKGDMKYNVRHTKEFKDETEKFTQLLKNRHTLRFKGKYNDFHRSKIPLSTAKEYAERCNANIHIFLAYIPDSLLRLELQGYCRLLREWNVDHIGLIVD